MHQLALALIAFCLHAQPSLAEDVFALHSGGGYVQHGMALMQACELGEDLPANQRPQGYCGHAYVVRYLKDQAEREEYRVVVANGALLKAATHEIYPDGNWYFVMDDSGNFYVFDKTGEAPLHHSSFFAGAPIAAGGDITISNGKVLRLGTHTGHYMMDETILQNAREALSDSGG